VWAGVDSAWEQEKLEARKMLAVGAAREASHRSDARFVGWRFGFTNYSNFYETTNLTLTL
jgi:hypothetical protein